MLQPLLMVCFLAVFLKDAVGDPWLSPWVSHRMAAVISLSLMAGIAILVHVRIWVAGRRLSRTGRGREVRRADLTVGAAWVAATVVHVFNILALGWLDAVRAAVGDLVAVDELLAILPVVGVIVAAWWSLYPIDRRVREAGLVRDLDEGRPVYQQVTRGGFVMMAVRHQLAIIMVPVMLVMGWSELVVFSAQRWWGAEELNTGRAAGLILLAQAAGTLAVFSLMPPLMRRVWDTVPLAPGGIRVRLDEMCRRHGVRNRELLVWRTQGTMINGAVMGLFAPVRYIMLTDSLLDHLNDRQVEAVMAHEVGHVRRKHMVWLAVAMVAAFAGVASVAGLVMSKEDVEWAYAPLTIVSLSIALVVFGFVSRRFEWQADAFAVQHLSVSGPGGESVQGDGLGGGDQRVTPEAVAAMTGALQAVADLNFVPPDRFSWRHGSIQTRQRRLAELVGLRVDGLPIDREAMVVKIVSALALLAAALLAAAAMFVAQATQTGTIPQ